MRRFSSIRERRTYQSWCDMKYRCNNTNHPRYADYGGRGITYTPDWETFEVFLSDMGLKPDGMTLERVDNDGSYNPDNCRWASYRDQNKNKRTTTLFRYDGRDQTIEEWAAEFGMPRTTLSERIYGYGWDIKTALESPLQHKANVPKDPKKRKFMPKLTGEQAEEIRRLYGTGEWSYRKLGKRFGVSGTAISKIINGESY